MSKDQLVERIKNIFQGRGQPQAAQPPFIVQSVQKEIMPVSDTDTIAAIAAALHLHLTVADAEYGSDRKSYALSPWSQYGREHIQNARFRIFNRPASSEKSILIRKR